LESADASELEAFLKLLLLLSRRIFEGLFLVILNMRRIEAERGGCKIEEDRLSKMDALLTHPTLFFLLDPVNNF